MQALQMLVAWVLGLAPFVAVVAYLIWRRRDRQLVRSYEVGLLYRDSVFQRELPPGLYTFFAAKLRVSVIRLTAVEQAGTSAVIDVAARDGFAFRLRLGFRFVILDRRGYHEQSAGQASIVAGMALPGFGDALAAAAMTAVSARTLAEVQADPGAIAAAVLAEVAPRFPAVTLTGMAVTSLQFPPETRKLLSEVEAARLRGLAALERARGEQAALRALANAARLIRDNPELGQLRLLQAVETARKAPTLVIGQAALPGSGDASAD